MANVNPLGLSITPTATQSKAYFSEREFQLALLLLLEQLATAQPGDLAIGAVELKDATAVDRAKIAILSGIVAGDIGLAVTDPVAAAANTITNAALGVPTGGAVVTDANGTIQQYLRGLVTLFAAGFGINQTTPGTTNAVAVVGGGSFAVTPLTANVGGTTTLASRAKRRGVLVVCLSSSPEPIYFGPTTGVTTVTGARIAAGESLPVDTTAALFFTSAAGTGTLQCVETYD